MNDLRDCSFSRRFRSIWAALFLAVFGLTIVFWSLSGTAAWATPAQDALRQTIIGPITLEVSRRIAAPGDPVIVIVRVTNIYAQDMKNAFVTIPIPDPLIVEQVTTTQGVVNVVLETEPGLIGSTVTADLGTIGPDGEVVINIKGLVRHDASPGTIIYLQGRLTYDGITVYSNVVTICLPYTQLPITGAPGIPWALLTLLLVWVAFLVCIALVLRPRPVRVEPSKVDYGKN